MSEIERYYFDVYDGTGIYKTGVAMATKVRSKMVELGFTCTEVTDVNGGGIEGQFFCEVSDDYDIKLNFNASNQNGVVLRVYDKDGNYVSNEVKANPHSSNNGLTTYLNLVRTNNTTLIGFSDWNQTTYRFHFGFTTHEDEEYWMYIPYSNGATQIDLYQGNTLTLSLKTLLNIKVSDQYKGIFHSFYLTNRSDFTDISVPLTEFYNINTGYVFTICNPVLINDIQFVPLNNYTLFKVGTGIV